MKHAVWLDKIERELGVQRQFVLAIWGRETAFGVHRSPHYAIKVLATQAYVGRRKDMFRNELLHALKMLQDGVRTRETLNSSWAGAMGLPQLMPSEFYTLAYDLDGDGRSDIWSSVADALGSAANQLRAKGWVPNQSWGYEVRLPQGHLLPLGRTGQRQAGARVGEGWRRARRRAIFPPMLWTSKPLFWPLPGHMARRSWRSRISWSSSATTCRTSTRCLSATSATASSAAATSARLGAEVRQLSAKGIEEIQEKLQALGYAVAKIDGKAGMNTRSLIGAYQKANRLKIDCWPTEALLEHVRVKTPTKGAEAGKGNVGVAPGGNGGRGAPR